MVWEARRQRAWPLIAAVLAGLIVLAFPGTASAHNVTQSYVYLDIYDDTIEGRVEYPVADLNQVLGLSLPNESGGALVAAEEIRDDLIAYSHAHFALFDLEGRQWAIEFGEIETLDAIGGAFIVMNFRIVEAFDTVPREFVAEYDGIIHALPERDALLLIGTDWGSGTFNNEASDLLRYTADSTVQTVDLGDSSFWSGLGGVIGLGVEHIRIGTDHILFIFALVLPSVLVFTRRIGWEPSPSFGSSLWRVLKIVTMFTLAHTITLTLGGLGIVEFPPALVETVIAVSIILAAMHNLRPTFFNREWIIAFVFGLFHGFGFAGLLSDLGLTQSRQFVSLLGFNLGIEIGQAFIILLIFPALFLARRTRIYLPAMYAGSVALIVVASAWAIDRATGFSLNVDWVVDRVVLWPRSLVFIGLAYVLAGAVYAFEHRREDLLPVAGGSDGDPASASTGVSAPASPIATEPDPS